jgi:hypothetical protein
MRTGTKNWTSATSSASPSIYRQASAQRFWRVPSHHCRRYSEKL